VTLVRLIEKKYKNSHYKSNLQSQIIKSPIE